MTLRALETRLVASTIVGLATFAPLETGVSMLSLAALAASVYLAVKASSSARIRLT